MQAIEWGQLKSTEFDRSAIPHTLAILPIGSTEQHGPHLPVAVDSLLVQEVALRTAKLLHPTVPVQVLPTLWISLAEHHMASPGSLTLDFATLTAFVRCVVSSLKRQGYQRILLLNGHGGNITALNSIVDMLHGEFDLPITTATYWMVAAQAFASILEGQSNLLHACEAETSMVMHLRPELVDVAAARTVSAPATGFFQSAGMYRHRGMAHWSCTGVVGTPRLASAHKGGLLLDAAALALADQLKNPAMWA